MTQDEVEKIVADAVAGSKKQSKWNQPSKKTENIMRTRQILNTLFMLGALITIILYFAFPENKVPFFSVGCAALILKIVEFILRFMF